MSIDYAVKDWRVQCSWGDGSKSYYYFETPEQARDFRPEPKPRYGPISGQIVGYRNPRHLTIQSRGPRQGWATCPAPAKEGK